MQSSIGQKNQEETGELVGLNLPLASGGTEAGPIPTSGQLCGSEEKHSREKQES